MNLTSFALLAPENGCFTTGGKGVRYSDRCLVILPRIVRAPYSNLSEAIQHGTMLWASTYNKTKHNNYCSNLFIITIAEPGGPATTDMAEKGH